MKSFITLLIACFFSISLAAQSNFVGTWSGSGVKNGQPMGFTLEMKKSGHFLMAYDLNPNDLTVKGTWSYKNEVLTFKNSDGILHMKRVSAKSGAGKASQKGTLEFKKNRNSTKFAYLKGPIVMMGWDEGVAAVVINHEER